jgi:hypothetical protein
MYEKRMSGKVRGMLGEVVYQIILLVLLMAVIYGNHDSNVYLQSQHLRNTFPLPTTAKVNTLTMI